MLIRSTLSGFNHPYPSEITPHRDYLRRRQWLALMGKGATGAASLGAGLGLMSADALAATAPPGQHKALAGVASKVPGASTIDKPTEYKDASSYNNYYEFGTDKDEPARRAHTLQTTPWTIEVEGLVKKPAKYALDDVMKLSAMEERIYRLRCVEGWSMVIPWVGYSLVTLLKKVELLPSAQFVEFVSLADKAQMPGIRSGVLDWPYTEGLRLDEAMHPLTMLAFGMYGEVLPNQNGAPVRLVVPWKYGFKSAKSIVKIRITDKMPATAWNKAARNEYGFYSNVNPQVDHPRWSQATERRIGDTGGLFAKRRKTEMLNGYADQVAQLYAGMDLRKNF